MQFWDTTFVLHVFCYQKKNSVKHEFTQTLSDLAKIKVVLRSTLNKRLDTRKGVSQRTLGFTVEEMQCPDSKPVRIKLDTNCIVVFCVLIDSD